MKNILPSSSVAFSLFTYSLIAASAALLCSWSGGGGGVGATGNRQISSVQNRSLSGVLSTRIYELTGGGGEYVEYVLNLDRNTNGVEDRKVILQTQNNEELDSLVGKYIQARGVLASNGVFSAYEMTPAVDQKSAIAANKANSATQIECSPLGPQKAIVLIVDYATNDHSPVPSKDEIRGVFLGSAASGYSVKSYWSEGSKGKATLSADVYGPYQLNGPFACLREVKISDAAIKMAIQRDNVDITKYNRIFVITPEMGCGYGGISTIGCETSLTSQGEINTSRAFIPRGRMSPQINGVQYTIHEGGHSLGLDHASSRSYSGNSLGKIGKKGQNAEYGDQFSSMGIGNFGHYAGPHRERLGWLNSSEIVEIKPADVTSPDGLSLTIKPRLSTSEGVRFAKIERVPGATLWVEYVTRSGQYDGRFDPAAALDGAMIHYDDVRTFRHTYLLDFRPKTSTFQDAPLIGTWKDKNSSLQLKVDNVTSSGFRLNVKYLP